MADFQASPDFLSCKRLISSQLAIFNLFFTLAYVNFLAVQICKYLIFRPLKNNYTLYVYKCF